VAGETGSGKTVLVRNLITSLAYATSPDELRMVLVDPKNEDLRPYADLPHVLLFAGRQEDVATAINRVAAEVDARVNNPQRKPYRLLLIVDELAQLTNINGAIKTLGSIMSIGRSKLVNCVVCTQQPTEEGGMGSMMKANVPLRLVGAVSAGQSYTATRRKNAGADMLPCFC
jgi:S-DNA-T family DNA segregation ATPase FtsK/SpoIIIE